MLSQATTRHIFAQHFFLLAVLLIPHPHACLANQHQFIFLNDLKNHLLFASVSSHQYHLELVTFLFVLLCRLLS